MNLQDTYGDAITLAISATKTLDGKADWNAFLRNMSATIIDSYDDSSIAEFRGKWKHAFKTKSRQMKLLCKRVADHWEQVIEPHLHQANAQATLPRRVSNLTTPVTRSQSSRTTSPKRVSNSISPTKRSQPSCTTSTSSLQYQRKLTAEDKAKLAENFEKISKKWTLKSGTVVEDVVFSKSLEFSFKHPSHSLIVDINDPLWLNCFSADDLREMVECTDAHNELNKSLPDNIGALLLKLNGKSTFREIYDEFDAIAADPVRNPEEYWMKRSVLDYACLFISDSQIAFPKTEQDLLQDIYGFIKKSSQLSHTVTETGTQSDSCSSSINMGRSVGSFDKVNRKISADHADLVFKYLSHELGCVEIGLEDEGRNGTKEMNEREIKTPTMMKNFTCQLVEHFKINSTDIMTVGLIISGLSISGLLMIHEKGSISLVKATERLRMPESTTTIARLLPPVLKLVYNYAQVIKSMTVYIDSVGSSVALESAVPDFFPPCFVSSAEVDSRKRKTSAIEE